jgi:hypothetical protein
MPRAARERILRAVQDRRAGRVRAIPSSTHANTVLALLCGVLQAGVARAEALLQADYAAMIRAGGLRNRALPSNQPVDVMKAANDARRGRAQP